MFELERGDAAELDASRTGVTARDDRRGLPPVEVVSPTPSQHGGWLRVPRWVEATVCHRHCQYASLLRTQRNPLELKGRPVLVEQSGAPDVNRPPPQRAQRCCFLP